MYYILDSNVWIELARGTIDCADVVRGPEAEVKQAPFVITELVRGIIKGGKSFFARNKKMVECMSRCAILELPRPFILQILWNATDETARVRPEHYASLLELITSSATLEQFLNQADQPAGAWRHVTHLDSIHENALDAELKSLKYLAEHASIQSLHVNMARSLQFCGLFCDPDAFNAKFSAAVEFLRSSIVQVRRGANPLKNNRGLYVDNQLFFYLGDAEAVIVTNEEFSQEIRESPQKTRVITFQAFRDLAIARSKKSF